MGMAMAPDHTPGRRSLEIKAGHLSEANSHLLFDHAVHCHVRDSCSSLFAAVELGGNRKVERQAGCAVCEADHAG